eukprot:5656330-Pleurochrysis_carterae.AAC.2
MGVVHTDGRVLAAIPLPWVSQVPSQPSEAAARVVGEDDEHFESRPPSKEYAFISVSINGEKERKTHKMQCFTPMINGSQRHFCPPLPACSFLASNKCMVSTRYP